MVLMGMFLEIIDKSVKISTRGTIGTRVAAVVGTVVLNQVAQNTGLRLQRLMELVFAVEGEGVVVVTVTVDVVRIDLVDVLSVSL